MIVCSVATNSHLPFAITMAESIRKHLPKAKVILGLVERDDIFIRPYLNHFDQVVLAKNLGFLNFDQHIFKHNSYEGAASCKARLLLYVMKRFPEENKFVYLDSDIKVYSDFKEVDQILEKESIMLTPHVLKPGPYDLNSSTDGIFNSGFLGLRNDEKAENFLNWWANKLDYLCYHLPEKGLFLDQRWLDHAPVLFDAYILRHRGYNLAFWNLYERTITKTAESNYLVENKPLRFVHFSALGRNPDYKKFLSEYNTNHNFIYDLFNEYQKDLNRNGYQPKTVPWSYDYFYSGEKVKMDSRYTYIKNLDRLSKIKDPYKLSNRFFSQLKMKETKTPKKINKRKRVKR